VDPRHTTTTGSSRGSSPSTADLSQGLVFLSAGGSRAAASLGRTRHRSGTTPLPTRMPLMPFPWSTAACGRERRQEKVERRGLGGPVAERGRTWSTAPSAVFPGGRRRRRVLRPGLPHGSMVAPPATKDLPVLLCVCSFFANALSRGKCTDKFLNLSYVRPS
jgi:hypothetical protein